MPFCSSTGRMLNNEDRKMVAAMERDLVRPLTEEEERLVLEPGPLIEQPPLNNSHDPHFDHRGRLRGDSRHAAAGGSVGYENEANEHGERLIWLEPMVVGAAPTGQAEQASDPKASAPDPYPQASQT